MSSWRSRVRVQRLSGNRSWYLRLTRNLNRIHWLTRWWFRFGVIGLPRTRRQVIGFQSLTSVWVTISLARFVSSVEDLSVGFAAFVVGWMTNCPAIATSRGVSLVFLQTSVGCKAAHFTHRGFIWHLELT